MLEVSRRAPNPPKQNKKKPRFKPKPSETLNDVESKTTLSRLLLDPTASYPVQNFGIEGGMQFATAQQG